MVPFSVDFTIKLIINQSHLVALRTGDQEYSINLISNHQLSCFICLFWSKMYSIVESGVLKFSSIIIELCIHLFYFHEFLLHILLVSVRCTYAHDSYIFMMVWPFSHYIMSYLSLSSNGS